MKSMKKVTSCLLALLLIVSLCVPAFATSTNEGQYETTRSFIDVLQTKGLKYTYSGLNSDNDEKIRVSFSDDNFGSIVFILFFPSSADEVSIRVWNLITVTAGKTYALNTVNTLNNNYKYARFYLDESDNTITCSMDAYLDVRSAGDTTNRMMSVLLDIITSDDCVKALLALK